MSTLEPTIREFAGCPGVIREQFEFDLWYV